MSWYKKTAALVIKELDTSATKGLSTADATKRLKKYGKNQLVDKGGKSAGRILLDQLSELMVIILIIAALISFIFLHEPIDGAVILIIVLLNTILGFYQEFNAEKAMAALKKLAVPAVRVRRAGQIKEIPAVALIPGDIVILESGNIIPADARLINSANLQVQESTLTGESQPVEKTDTFTAYKDIALADRKNMLYMGTIITYGRGEAVVTDTGMNTELGKIATLLQEVEDEATPLQKRLNGLSKALALAALFLIAIVGTVSLLKGASLQRTLMTAISMAVAAIPEGLPAVVTIALALGAKKMLKKKALIRQLMAVETLGSVTVICSDKTGTLTQNKMTVTDIVLPDKQAALDIKGKLPKDSDDYSMTLTTAVLCNDAAIKSGQTTSTKNMTVAGDPTEGCLVIAGAFNGFIKNSMEKAYPRVRELPFDSKRKRMTTIHQIKRPSKNIESLLHKGSYAAFTKGAIDGLLKKANRILIKGKVKKLSSSMKKKLLEENKAFAANGVRVLGFAFRPLLEKELDTPSKYEEKLIYSGMTAIIDPPRPEVKDAVSTCNSAGIKTVMITGDHPLTALAIAKQLGISNNDKALRGSDLENLTAHKMQKIVKEVSVFARVSPEHKMKIIDALQANGQIVSMTGDGVNDAPALKSADIGVAMGITGTDVAKQSADMVLLDDNFTTIVSAVKAGRTIYDNIKKFIKYILTGNTGEILVMLIAPFLGMPLALLPKQILWINLVTDGAPGVALGYEPGEKSTMNRPPFNPKESIFARGVGSQILWVGTLVAILSLGVGYLFFLRDPKSAWQTMIFTTLTFCQMQYAMAVRSNSTSIFRLGLSSNKLMSFTVLITFILQLLLIYVPFLNDIFGTQPLSLSQLLICFLASLIVLATVETVKILRNRKIQI